MRIASMLLLGLALASAPAFATNTVYSNGPINGTINAWNIGYRLCRCRRIQRVLDYDNHRV